MNLILKGYFYRKVKAVLFLMVLFLCSAVRAHFYFPPLPVELYAPVVPDFAIGSYTVDWQATNGHICRLSEKVDGGDWATVPNTNSPISTITLTRALGAYHYQVFCIGESSVSVGPISSITVAGSIPSLDPLDVQLGYQFQVRSGDINADGKKDIYIKRTSGGNENNGVIDKTIITQNIDGRFDVLENPTAGQFSVAGGWPIASGVTTVINDFNVDGRVDVLLKNLNQTITGLDDQIVFSTGRFFKGQAQAATAMGFEFEKFFRDTYNWILDPNYFTQAITSSLPAYNFSLDIGVYFCSYWLRLPTCLNVVHSVFERTVTLSMLGLSGYETTEQAEQGLANALGFASYDTFECVLVCGWIEYYSFYGSTVFTFVDTWTPTTESPGFDDINFSAWARDLADISENIGNGSAEIEGVKDIFEEVLGGLAGVVLGGEGLGEIIVFDGSHSVNDYKEDKKITLSLMRVIGAQTDIPATPKVELRSRVVSGFLPSSLQTKEHHLSVHSPTSVLIPSWYSGFPSEGVGSAVGPGGFLLSQERYSKDIRKLTNMVVGYVESPIYSDANTFWSALTTAALSYDNGLTYCLFPELNQSLIGSCNGYNSNSYAMGLIKSRGGIVTPVNIMPNSPLSIPYPITNTVIFPGVQKYVPSSEF